MTTDFRDKSYGELCDHMKEILSSKLSLLIFSEDVYEKWVLVNVYRSYLASNEA